MSTLSWAALVLAAIPFVLALVNLMLYTAPPPVRGRALRASVLIPARNEELRIERVLHAVMASEGIELEILVGDDNSTDLTASIITAMSAIDPRVRLVSVPPLPEGWAGKNHACQTLADHASHDIAVFLDADVTVTKDALARIVAQMEDRKLDLSSGFPKLVTGSFWEHLAIPLVHVVLLGYLPLIGMRLTRWAAFATACGQLIAVRMSAYREVGGHHAIRGLLHDGVQIPRKFRKAGFVTDLFDATSLAATRMYDNLPDLWAGFMKNAHEGMATPVALPVWTVLLGGGHILPVVLAVIALTTGVDGADTARIAAAVALSYGMRFMMALRFHRSMVGALLHPFGMAFLLTLQWVALVRHAKGQTVSWKGRDYGEQS